MTAPTLKSSLKTAISFGQQMALSEAAGMLAMKTLRTLSTPAPSQPSQQENKPQPKAPPDSEHEAILDRHLLDGIREGGQKRREKPDLSNASAKLPEYSEFEEITDRYFFQAVDEVARRRQQKSEDVLKKGGQLRRERACG